jgi:hypothetical protein
LGLFATVLLSARAALASDSCPKPGDSRVTFSLDGVQLSLCTSFMPAPAVTAANPADSIQMATAVDRSVGYKELSVEAIPYGLRSPAEDLPAAQAGGAAAYRAQLQAYRAQQGGQPQPGPAATFFGQSVPGTVSVVSLNVDDVISRPVTITEWVLEAGSRLWIIRALQAAPPGQSAKALGLPAAVPDIDLNSLDVTQPSSSLSASKSALPKSLGGHAVSSAGNIPAPPWWNGQVCDATHYAYSTFNGVQQNPAHRPSYALGGSYRGILACGPRPYYDAAPDVIVQFFPGAWGQYEWECVELSMRFMRMAYGIAPYSGNGKDVVWNYRGTELVAVPNGTVGAVPAPGDVLSYCAGCVRVGHTAVVSASNVDFNGNGTLTVMEQNNSPTGSNTLKVTGWSVGSGVTGWLHFPGNGTVSGTVHDGCGPVAGATVRLQKWMVDVSTTTDANGNYSFSNIPAGSATVTVSYAPLNGTASGTATASIVALQTTAAPDIFLSGITGNVHGVVRGPVGGTPVAGATVQLQQGSLVQTTVTGADGAYAFANIPPGPATVAAARLDGSASAPVNVSCNQDTAADMVLSYDDAAYVADVSFPDAAVFAPSQPVVKTWRMQNTGSAAWDSSFRLVFISGDPMATTLAVGVPATPPGQMADISASLTTPPSGSHFGYWRMLSPQRGYFGTVIYPEVTVQTPGPYLTLQVSPDSPANASRVRVYGRADGLPNFAALRLLLDGAVVAQTPATELYYTWNTAGYSLIGHSLVLEAANWTDSAWKHPERRGVVFTLQGTSNTVDIAPDRPALASPADGSALPAPVQLCALGADINGDLLSYQFELTGPGGTVDSAWVASCYLPAGLIPGVYSWRVKTRDTSSVESLWSAAQSFTVVAPDSSEITSLSLQPLDPAQEQIRVLPCTSLSAPVTVSVRVNTAADGSDSGRWDVISEQAGACFTGDAAPVWNTLPYSDGIHLVRVVAASPATTVMSDTLAALGARRPLAPTLLAPAPASGLLSDPVYLTPGALSFRWQPSARADSHTLLVSTNPNPQSDPSPLVSWSLPGTAATAAATVSGNYPALYWQVVAANTAGSSASGAQRLSLDSGRPQCSVQYNSAISLVSWSAADAESGIAGVDISFADANQGGVFPWLLNLPATVTSAPFTGQVGRSYNFRCEAFDLAGNDSYSHTYLPIITH